MSDTQWCFCLWVVPDLQTISMIIEQLKSCLAIVVTCMYRVAHIAKVACMHV